MLLHFYSGFEVWEQMMMMMYLSSILMMMYPDDVVNLASSTERTVCIFLPKILEDIEPLTPGFWQPGIAI